MASTQPVSFRVNYDADGNVVSVERRGVDGGGFTLVQPKLGSIKSAARRTTNTYVHIGTSDPCVEFGGELWCWEG
jgi:hypothetical protein